MKQIMNNTIIAITLLVLILASSLSGCDAGVDPNAPNGDIKVSDKILRFESAQQLADAFKEAQEEGRYDNIYYMAKGLGSQALETAAMPSGALGDTDSGAGRDFSETNVQVEGVDEADIIKTDGDYIYAVAKGKLYIAKVYPADEAKLLSTVALDKFYPQEIFIDKDRLLMFGNEEYTRDSESSQKCAPGTKCIEPYYPMYMSMVSVKLFDTSDKENPQLLRTVDFEGNYITSRKIGDYAYFVINSWPHYDYKEPADIIPFYSEDGKDAEPIAQPTDISYIEPLYAQNFIIAASISMMDETKEVSKEVIVGNGQNVYASLENLYIAQTSYTRYDSIGELITEPYEKTIISKFSLDDGNIKFLVTGEVKGHILNQFSMDEYDNHFRIATTKGQVWDEVIKSTNNVYVLDPGMKVVGSLEDLAPGEKIYSVRFMGKKGYIVTFKKVDPLFVIDLSDHASPKVLGKLKIPGYSDYLHPYDESHIIGIGKDAVDAEQELVEQRDLDFAWYQGVKMAIFDVSDVEHPVEMYKVQIGDRGTESPVLQDHKAFLFDKEKNLLVLPITVAEVKGEKFDEYGNPNYGDVVFQGAYVYDVSLDKGFELRGTVSHNTDEDYIKSGYYMGYQKQIQRSLYIDNVLYTMSDAMIKMNDLSSLGELNSLKFE